MRDINEWINKKNCSVGRWEVEMESGEVGLQKKRPQREEKPSEACGEGVVPKGAFQVSTIHSGMYKPGILRFI